MADATFFATQAEFHDWLQEHAASATELVLGFHKKASGNGGITYAQALDEALCFGWIDGLRKGRDDATFTIRFTPRKPRSIWSAVNIKRAEELTALGRMRPTGLAAFAARDETRSRIYSYEQPPADLDEAALQVFRADEQAWSYFQKQAPSYRRTAAHWVLSAKKAETRHSRLATLIADCAAGRRLAHLSYTSKRDNSTSP